MMRNFIKKIIFFCLYRIKINGIVFRLKDKINFKCRPLANFKNKVVIVSTHSDDESIGCGAMIAKNGGDNFEFTLITEPTEVKLKEKRYQELDQALLTITGKQIPVEKLFFEDGKLKNSQDELYETLRTFVVDNNVRVAFVNSIFDFHSDHRAAGLATIKLLTNGVLDEVYLYFTNHPIYFPLINSYIGFNREVEICKFNALKAFKTQTDLNFSGLKILNQLNAELLDIDDIGAELFIRVDRDNYKLVMEHYNNVSGILDEHECNKSTVHPFTFDKNILFWTSN
ncbi:MULTISPECIES: PIG-L deacetylase family protein [Vibrio]|uniref:PIG-L deacetylase family protein n=1 Tax=Vibrio TaxID=662 RepID=UPI00215C5860|nr:MULTISPECIES: PIG-L family deacetylase [Vibrio]MCR9533324.1 PIG-L family deacetylase [Vibrio alginolyticus]MDW2067530.1 PIG-L family deacetylase [Vibrio sp. 1579]